MISRKFIILALSLLFSAVTSSNVWACTGRPYAAEIEDIDEFDLWVKATVIDRDDRGYNAILNVKEYYKGDGPRLLVVNRHWPALESVTGARGYSNGCIGNGGGQEYRRGASGYFGLKPNRDGTFTDWHYGSSILYVREGVVPFYDDYEWKEIAEADLQAKLLSLGERAAPVAPIYQEVQRYPLMRYLMITTDNGTRYQVNPDRSVMPVQRKTPHAMSPDGAHWVYRLDENTLGFGRPYEGHAGPVVNYFNEISGREVRFSNDSNMVAVWDESQLSIYVFSIGGYNYRGGMMSINQIATVALNTNGGQETRVVWSDDSTTLAWQDASGIWRWNLYEDEQPTQIVADYDCHLIDISSGGRYLRYGTARGWTLHDSSTGKRYSNAFAAPGEKVLVFINRENEPIPPWRGGYGCPPPLSRNCALYIDVGVRPVEITIFPRTKGMFGVLFCEYDGLCDDRSYRWNPSTLWHGHYWTEPDMDQKPWRQYAYDPFYDRKAILYGNFRIDFETRADMFFKASDDVVSELLLDSLDLEDIVDSPIASIEWGQPIFYHVQAMTASEYMPRTVTAYRADFAPQRGASEA